MSGCDSRIAFDPAHALDWCLVLLKSRDRVIEECKHGSMTLMIVHEHDRVAVAYRSERVEGQFVCPIPLVRKLVRGGDESAKSTTLDGLAARWVC